MGRRWWQKEARRVQDEQATAPTVAPVIEEAADITDIHVDALAAAIELAETVSIITDNDVDQIKLTPEQEAVEDAKDAEAPAPVIVTKNQFAVNNNKKKRR
jgi:hypothetical protein